MRNSFYSSFIAVILASVLLAACGGGGGSETQPPPPPSNVTVTISPSTATVVARATKTFTATVTGSANNSVTFSVVEGSNGGTVSGAGIYRAPSTLGTYRVRATSVADPTKFADAVVTVNQGQAERLPNAPDGFDYAATSLLPDGSVFIVGGRGFNGLHIRAQRFTIAGGFVLDGTMASYRVAPASFTFASGKTLVLGGDDPTVPFDPFRPVLKTTEIYDPATQLFSAGPDMTVPRWHHKVTQLTDGRLLITGGLQLAMTGNGASGNNEIYDPAGNTFTATGRMVESGRWLHTATLLPNGKVLVVGGRSNTCTGNCPVFSLASAEIFDPATGAFTATGSLTISRHSHTATLLPNGKVLIVGGESTDLTNEDQVQQTEIYDPATGTFSRGPMLLNPRGSHNATVLSNGKLWITGGYTLSGVPTVTTEFLDLVTGEVTRGPDLNEHHVRHAAPRLPGGEIVILGGSTGYQFSQIVEVLR